MHAPASVAIAVLAGGRATAAAERGNLKPGTDGPSFHITLSHEQLVQLLIRHCPGRMCTAEEIRTRFQIPNDIAEDEALTSRALRK
jgi:hypothetical protein